MKQIIAIVGMPGAGKSEAASFFKQKNLPVIRFGKITDEIIAAAGLPLTQENEKTTREKLRNEHGMGAYAIKNEPKIRAAIEAEDIVILDGLRSWEEYEYLIEKFENLYLLAIYATPAIRHERLKARKIRNLSIKESVKRDIAEIINLHMAPPIALANNLIKNETTVDDLHSQLENFLSEIKN